MTSNVDESSTHPARSPRTASNNNNNSHASSTATHAISTNGIANNHAAPDKRPSPRPGTAAATASSPARSRHSSPPARHVVHKKEDDASAAANESEAETEILSDAAPDENDAPATRRAKKPTVKREDTDDEGTTRRNGVVNGSGGLASKGERPRRKSNSTAVSTSPHHSPPPHSIKSPSHHRGRSMSLAESRKRKARDEAALKHVEPPRQRQRTEGSNGATNSTTGSRESPSLRNQPTSPAISAAAGIKAHRRSASTQSALQGSQATRRKRDLANLILQPQKRDGWHSASSSDGDSSPRPSHPSVQSHPQLKRASHRSLTSPARAMVHDKKRTDRFGATKLAREAERGDIDAVKAAFSENPDDLDQPDFAGIAPLQKAALNGHVDVVEFLIDSGCKTDCQSDNRDTPLIDAAENGHLDVIKVLLRKGKVNPHHQNKKGERAIDLIPSDDEDYEEMSRELKEAMLRESDTSSQKEGPPTSAKAEPSGLLYNEYNTATLKAKAAEGDMQLVGELLASNVKPNIQCGVAAARAGHYEILSLFLAEGLKPDPDPSKHPDTPMTVAIGRGHLKVIELLLGLDNFDPTRRTKDGRTYYELAEERRGPKWEQEREMLKHAFDEYSTKRQRNSPKRERKPVHAVTGGSASASSLQAKQKPLRKSSPRPSERSSSPARAAAAESKRQVSRKAALASEPDPPKSRRLVTAKELSSQRDAAKRRRRVVDDDESSSSESDVQDRRPQKKHASKHRVSSDGEDAKPVKKHPVKSRIDGHEKSRKLRTSSPPAHSDDSGGENRKALPKKTTAKPRSVDPPKNRAVQPTPETSSDAESHRKAKKTSPKSGSSSSASKVKSEPGVASPSDQSKHVGQPSPADTSKSAAHPSPCPPSEPSAPSPAPPSIPPPPSRTPTPVREERIAEAKRKEEERIAAEKAREEEERARQEAERLRLEAAEKARLEAERLERLSKLPPALRRACEKGMDRPLCFDGDELGITFSFFPIHAFPLSDIDPTAHGALPVDDPGRSRQYILSFQAVGVLGLPELDISQSYPDWERREVTDDQWELFLQQYDVARMAQDFRFPMEGTKYWDDGDIQHRLWDAREKMKAMRPLYWLPLDVFEKEVKTGGRSEERGAVNVEENNTDSKESKESTAILTNSSEAKQPDPPVDSKDDKMEVDTVNAPETVTTSLPATTEPLGPEGKEPVKGKTPVEETPEQTADNESQDRADKVREMLRSIPLEVKRYIKVRKEPLPAGGVTALVNGEGMVRKRSFIDLVMNK